MSERTEKLAGFLKQVSNMDWDEFVKAEADPSYTTNEAVIFALVRACANKNLAAIKLAINRLDGKLKTPIKIEYPKVFFLYPNATLPAGDMNVPTKLEQGDAEMADVADEVEIIDVPAVMEPQKDLPSMSFRETLAKMSDMARDVPQQIVDSALQTEQWMRKQSPPPFEIFPVKAVVAAHLLLMAQSRNLDAISEVFDSIDGKLVETIQVLGDDLFITNYSAIAPPNAKPNKDGVLMAEATETQKMWANKLAQEK